MNDSPAPSRQYSAEGLHLLIGLYAPARLWRRQYGYGIALVILMLAGYICVLGLTLGLRFQQWPNYLVFYPWWDNLQLIISGTPAWHDTWLLMLDEAWLELGFRNPDYYGIAEWSYALIPVRVLGLLLASTMLATILLYYRDVSRQCAVTRDSSYQPDSQSTARLGKTGGLLLMASGGLIGLTSATISWVVCCATPTWAVYLSILGLSSSLSLQIEPFGNLLFAVALGVLLLWLLVIGRHLSRLDPCSQPSDQSGKPTAKVAPGSLSGSLSAFWQQSGGIHHGRQR